MEDFTKEERIEQSIRLKKARMIRGLSVDEFSERIGMSMSGYQKVENGQNAVSKRLLRGIWNEFHISADYILYGESAEVEKILAATEACRDEDKIYILWNLAKYFVLSKKTEKFHMGISRKELTHHLREWADIE